MIMLLHFLNRYMSRSVKMMDLSAANPCGPPLLYRLSNQGTAAESVALILLTPLSLCFCFSNQVEFWFSSLLFSRSPEGCECMSVSMSAPLTQRWR